MTFAAKPFVVAVNHLLAREPWARACLAPYAGKRARLACAPFVLTLRVQPDGYFAVVDQSAPDGAASDQPASGDGFATATTHASGKAAASSGAAFSGETGKSGQSSRFSQTARPGKPGRADNAGDSANPGNPNDAQPVDVTLSVSVDALPAFVQGGQAAAMKHVRIEGDAEFAQTLGKLAGHLRWEPEEDLARFIGDAGAVRMTSFARSAGNEARRAGRNLLGSVVEYLIDEKALLVRRAELDDFNAELARTRDALARAEKRVERLERAQRHTEQRHTQNPTQNHTGNRMENGAERAATHEVKEAGAAQAPQSPDTPFAPPGVAPRVQR